VTKSLERNVSIPACNLLFFGFFFVLGKEYSVCVCVLGGGLTKPLEPTCLELVNHMVALNKC